MVIYDEWSPRLVLRSMNKWIDGWMARVKTRLSCNWKWERSGDGIYNGCWARRGIGRCSSSTMFPGQSRALIDGWRRKHVCRLGVWNVSKKVSCSEVPRVRELFNIDFSTNVAGPWLRMLLVLHVMGDDSSDTIDSKENNQLKPPFQLIKH